jgi:hypothetical protein
MADTVTHTLFAFSPKLLGYWGVDRFSRVGPCKSTNHISPSRHIIDGQPITVAHPATSVRVGQSR